MKQLHKKFTDSQIKDLLNRYLSIYPLNKTVSEVRFWCNDKLIDVQRAKNSDLKLVHF